MASGRDRVGAALAGALLAVLSACGSDDAVLPGPSAGAAGGMGGNGGAGGAVLPDCDPGQIVGPDDECMAVGIQGCAELFMEDDNLCHPSMDKCPAGTIPKFDEGCVPVGIPASGCPELFMEEDGLCHPSMDKCPEGTFAAPLLGCVPIDGEQGCGTGTWGHIPDGPDTVWVDPSYQGGDGDGTTDKPLGTIAAALAIAVDGGRIALAAGSYDEPVYIDKTLELVGRCPSMVTISGTQPFQDWSYPGIVVIDGAVGVVIRNLRLSGDGFGVIAIAATASLEGLHIEQTSWVAVMADFGAELSVNRCLVADTQAPPPAGSGSGLALFGGTTVTVANSAFVANRGGGLQAYGYDEDFIEYQPALLTVDASLIEGSLDTGDGARGAGIVQAGGAEVRISASAVVRNCYAGVWGYDGAAGLYLDSSLVEDTQPKLDGRYGHGVFLYGATAHLVSNALVANRRTAIEANDDSAVEAHGNLALNTIDELKWPGLGVMVRLGSSVIFTDNAVVGSQGAGVALLQSADDALVERNLIEDNGDPDDGETVTQADGLVVYGSDGAVVASNALVGNRGMGLRVQEAAAVARDNLIERSAHADHMWWRRGQGIDVRGAGTTAQLQGNAVLDSAAAGVWVFNGATVVVQRLFVADTQPYEPDGEYGVGLHVTSGALAELDHVVVSGNHLAAVLVQGATVNLSRSRLTTTVSGSFTSLACPMPPCPWNMQNTYLDIADGLIAVSSDVTMIDVRVDGCARAGVLFHGSSGQLTDVRSADNGFGLVLQGSPRPAVSDDCLFGPNTEQNVLEDSKLAVPNDGSELPEAPGG